MSDLLGYVNPGSTLLIRSQEECVQFVQTTVFSRAGTGAPSLTPDLAGARSRWLHALRLPATCSLVGRELLSRAHSRTSTDFRQSIAEALSRPTATGGEREEPKRFRVKSAEGGASIPGWEDGPTPIEHPAGLRSTKRSHSCPSGRTPSRRTRRRGSLPPGAREKRTRRGWP